MNATAAFGSTILLMATALAAKRVTANELATALEAVWSRDTSADPASWSDATRAWGQCAVTALVVQDYFGGELRRGEVGAVSHYWNVLPSGNELDFTRHQFPDDVDIANVEPRTREYVLSHAGTARRYYELACGVRHQLHLTTRTD